MMIRSALFNAAFWLWIGLIGLAGLPFSLIYRPFSLVVAKGWAWGSLWLLRVLCNITFEVRGTEHMPQGACLVASKHQSAWDTIIFWALLKKPVYVLKKELIYFPIFGWYLLLLRNIYIDRKTGAKALRMMLHAAEDRAKRNYSVVIYPEGTRTLPGSHETYHPGVAALYQHLKLPVVPVALNSGLFWGRNAFVKKSGKIVIEFLPPIQPGLKNRNFLAQLQTQIESHCAALK